MSVLIKGMEMPESCYYCPFVIGSWGYSPPHRAKCIISGKDMPIDERNVQHNHISCPLIEIKPHGRLVDADALKKKWLEAENRMGADKVIELPLKEYITNGCVYDLDNAPTIIESEEMNG